jgi:hypothetical protein
VDVVRHGWSVRERRWRAGKWLQLRAFCDNLPLKRLLLPADPTDTTPTGRGRIMRSGVQAESEAVMKSIGCAAVWVVLGASFLAPAWADDALDEPAQGLRLPGEPGVGSWARAPQHALRLWASDVSQRLAHMGRPRMPALRWRLDGADVSGHQAD